MPQRPDLAVALRCRVRTLLASCALCRDAVLANCGREADRELEDGVDEASLLQLPVRRAMREVVIGVMPQTSIDAAIQLFRERHIHGAPVLDDQSNVVGFVALSDLASVRSIPSEHVGHSRHVIYQNGEKLLESSLPTVESSSRQGVVADVMTPRVRSIPADTLLRVAVGIMSSEEIHRLVIMENNQVVGMLSSMDVLRLLVPPVGTTSIDGF